MLAWFRDVEIFTKQRFRDAFTLSGARATSLLDGYVAIGALREKVKGDRTHYVYRHPRRAQARPSSRENGRTVRFWTGHFPRRDSDRNKCPKNHGHGHENEGNERRNP